MTVDDSINEYTDFRNKFIRNAIGGYNQEACALAYHAHSINQLTGMLSLVLKELVKQNKVKK